MFVDIYGVQYEILLTSQDKIRKEVDNPKDNIYFGIHVPMKQIILIDNSIKGDVQIRTLIHEVTHAIIFVLGYGKMNEENICDFMGAHHSVIDNIIKKWSD